jgi:hypothetical protein
MGWPESAHPPALLVDEDRSIGAADHVAEIFHQRNQTIRRCYIALEKDQTPWRGFAQERTFRRRYFSTSKSCDECAFCHRRGLARRRRRGQAKGMVLRIEIWRRSVINSGIGARMGPDQFFWIMQLPPADLRLSHSATASSREANGPTWTP